MRRTVALPLAVAALALVFLASIAGAAEPAPAAGFLPATGAPAMSPASPATCSASLALPELPGLAPAAPFQAVFLCGACSVPICRNVGPNASCGTGGLHCVINNTCSTKPLTWMCLCATQPP